MVITRREKGRSNSWLSDGYTVGADCGEVNLYLAVPAVFNTALWTENLVLDFERVL